MERRQLISGMSPRHIGVFLGTCALHAAAIYWLAIQVAASRDSVGNALEVLFIPTEKPTEPPPPAQIPILLSDAFAERPLMDIPPPEVELSAPQEPSEAIEAPTPATPPPTDLAPQEGQGYGPLTRPLVVSRPKYPEERYPRASIRHKESGRTIVEICISATGTVDSVQVAESSGYRRLDEAAADMGLDYVFAPAMREGKAIPVCLPYKIEFRLAVGGARRGR